MYGINASSLLVFSFSVGKNKNKKNVFVHFYFFRIFEYLLIFRSLANLWKAIL